MPVSIDDKESARQLLRERIAHVHAQHEVRREVGAPGSRVVEIIFGVQRIVADETTEDAALNRQALTDRSEIRDVSWSQLAQYFVTTDVGSSRRKTKQFRVLAGLRS